MRSALPDGEEALQVLRDIANGTLDYDFEGLHEVIDRRGEHLT